MDAAKKIQGRKRANVHSVTLDDQVRHFYAYTLPHGHTIDDALVPEYWANEGKKFRLFDRIELRAEDMSFWAEAIVIARGDSAVKLHILQAHDLSGKKSAFDKSIADEYEIKWRGLKGHSVVRKADKVVISDGHENEEEAKKALMDHLKAMEK